MREAESGCVEGSACIGYRLGVIGEMGLGLQAVAHGQAIINAVGFDPGLASFETRLLARGFYGPTVRLIVALHERDLRAALRAGRDGLLPSPSALRVYYKEIEPGVWPLLRWYLRRLAKLPIKAAPLLTEVVRAASLRLPGYTTGSSGRCAPPVAPARSCTPEVLTPSTSLRRRRHGPGPPVVSATNSA